MYDVRTDSVVRVPVEATVVTHVDLTDYRDGHLPSECLSEEGNDVHATETAESPAYDE